MKRILLPLLVSLLAITKLDASATDTSKLIRHYDSGTGISQNSVFSILQDSDGFMWLATKDGLNRFDGYEFKVFRKGCQCLDDNIFNCIEEDLSRKLWIGTDSGLFSYDMDKCLFSKLDVSTQYGKKVSFATHMVKTDRRGCLWILAGGHLFKLDPSSMELKYIPDCVGKTFAATSIFVDKDNDVVYVAVSGEGIYCLNPDNLSFRMLAGSKTDFYSIVRYTGHLLLAGSHETGLHVIDCMNGKDSPLELSCDGETEQYVRVIEKMSDDEFWIGGENGIFILREESVSHLGHEDFNPFSLGDKAVHSLAKDRDGGIWIGTYYAGVDYISPNPAIFRIYQPSATRASIAGWRTRSIVEDSEGDLWIACEDGGISRFDRAAGQFTNYTKASYGRHRISLDNVGCLTIRNNLLWAGSISNGIEAIDISGNAASRRYCLGCRSGLLNDDVSALYTDRDNTLWAGTSTGLYTFDEANDRFLLFPHTDSLFVSSIGEDHFGVYWFTTFDNGIYSYNPVSLEVRNFRHSSGDPSSLGWDRVACQFEASDGTMWFGTEGGGLCRFDRSKGLFSTIDSTNGLPSNMVYKILEDSKGSLWLSTGNGMACFDPDTGTVTDVFDTSDGLPSLRFSLDSGAFTEDGLMYFGTVRGLVCFKPENTAHPVVPHKVVITGMDISERKGSTAATMKPDGDRITLKSAQSSITLRFSSMDYASAGISTRGEYCFKLDGVDSEWRSGGEANSAYYNNIPFGTHVFHVKYCHSCKGPDAPETIFTIRIKPPFALSGVAIFTYSCVFLLLLVLINRKVKSRRLQSEEKEREEQEQKRREEIYNTKIEFFTNIAHEIRTPLTLIKIPLQYILTTSPDHDDMISNLHVMSRNTDRLLELVNQLLDFRKIEESRYTITLKSYDMKDILSETFNRFVPSANRKQLDMSLSLPEREVVADVDKEAIIKVVSNLFTNALKYASTYIRVLLEVSLDGSSFIVRVNNDGKRIPDNMSNKIFEAFYQVRDQKESSQQNSGSGIGLAFSSRLVCMHKGDMYLDTGAPDTSFVVRIPLRNKMTDGNNPAGEAGDVDDNGVKLIGGAGRQDKAETILAVDDNEELRTMLVKYMEPHYQMLTAADGVEALKIIKSNIVDLVITDVMMPNMDGVELCGLIKNDNELCHIPVVMLTAKTKVADKIASLQSGADAYLEKPFSIDHLIAQVDNLIEKNRRLLAAFKETPNLDMGQATLNKMDEAYLNKVKEIILEHLEDEEYDVEQLAFEMHTSRSSLHRKIKGVTHMTPGEFIRVIRLKKAAELLREGSYRVNEVCLMVGIRSLSYFSKSFQKMFGVLPKDFAKKK